MPELTTAALEHIINEFFLSGGKQNLSAIAGQYSIDDLIRPFENLRRSMTRVLNGLTEEQTIFSPDANTYSASEVVSHLVAAQGLTYNAFIDLVCIDLPHIDPVPRNPGGGAQKGVSASELQVRLHKVTDELVRLLRQTYDPAVELEIVHPIAGSLTFKGWMLFQLVHDLDHLKQAQALRRSSYFPSKHAVSTEPQKKISQ